MKRICLALVGCFIASMALGTGDSEHLRKRLITVHELPLPLVNVLSKAGISYFEDFGRLTESKVNRIEGIGSKYLKLIKARLADYNLPLGPRTNSPLPLLEQSIDVLDLPLGNRESLHMRRIDRIGQLIMLSRLNLRRFTQELTGERIERQLASLDLELETIHPGYDVGVDVVFSKQVAAKLKEFDVQTLRELTVLSYAECESIVSKSMKKAVFPSVRAELERKKIVLGQSAFSELPLSARLFFYRHGVHTYEDAQEFLQRSDNPSLKILLDGQKQLCAATVTDEW